MFQTESLIQMERNIIFSKGSHTLPLFVTSVPHQEHVHNPDSEEKGNIWCDKTEIFLVDKKNQLDVTFCIL